MKEIENLDAKNDCFGEIDCKLLTQEMKDKVLPLLVIMVMKRDSGIKSRGVANGSLQIFHTNKSECTLLTPYFYSLKCVCAVSVKEERYIADVDLPEFFLQAEADTDYEPIIINLTGATVLLLVKTGERWRKNLRVENGKWIIYAACRKVICCTINAALMVHKNLSRFLK